MICPSVNSGGPWRDAPGEAFGVGNARIGFWYLRILGRASLQPYTSPPEDPEEKNGTPGSGASAAPLSECECAMHETRLASLARRRKRYSLATVFEKSFVSLQKQNKD